MIKNEKKTTNMNEIENVKQKFNTWGIFKTGFFSQIQIKFQKIKNIKN